MSESLVDYWDEVVPCPSLECDPPEHTRMHFRHLGMVCGRCNKHTGNESQGHYWGICQVWLAEGKPWKDAIRELHFCCPDDCSLEADDE